jgi:hypothetical protein
VPLRPRLYRWKTFWLGIFVLLFLAGAWLRSIHYTEKVVFGNPHSTGFAQVGQNAGVFYVSVFLRPDANALTCFHAVIGPCGDLFAVWRDPHGRPYYDLAPPILFDRQSDWWSFGISHWFLILLFLPHWITFLRQRLQLMHGMESTILPYPAS